MFRALSESKEFNYTIYSDEQAEHKTLRAVPFDDEKQGSERGCIRRKKIRNYWITRRFLFQPALIANALRGKERTLICSGNMWYLSTWIAALICKWNGKKFYMWTHGSLAREKNLLGRVRRIFYKLSDGLLLYGHRARKILAEAGYPKEKMHVIYNSLDYKKQKEILSTINSGIIKEIKNSLFKFPDLPVLLVLGRMVSRVNYPLLIDAITLLHDEGVLCNVLIIGEGPEKDGVLKKISEKDLNDYFCFYGACYDEEKLGLLISSADVTVGPGHIGLACIHSLTYGTPVISHDDLSSNLGPEFEVLQEGINGARFKKNDPRDLADVIRNWLSNVSSREEVSAICQGSIVPEYTPEYQVNKINEVVRDAWKKE